MAGVGLTGPWFPSASHSKLSGSGLWSQVCSVACTCRVVLHLLCLRSCLPSLPPSLLFSHFLSCLPFLPSPPRSPPPQASFIRIKLQRGGVWVVGSSAGWV